MLSPQQRLDGLQQKLQQCVASVQSGAVPNLEGVDREVERLCQQVLMLPKEEGQPFLTALQELSDAFTTLGTAMEGMKYAIQDELGELQNRAKAHKAYGMRGTVNIADTDAEGGE